jgi:hypothetical protein
VFECRPGGDGNGGWFILGAAVVAGLAGATGAALAAKATSTAGSKSAEATKEAARHGAEGAVTAAMSTAKSQLDLANATFEENRRAGAADRERRSWNRAANKLEDELSDLLAALTDYASSLLALENGNVSLPVERSTSIAVRDAKVKAFEHLQQLPRGSAEIDRMVPVCRGLLEERTDAVLAATNPDDLAEHIRRAEAQLRATQDLIGQCAVVVSSLRSTGTVATATREAARPDEPS